MLKIKRLNPDVILPLRATPGSAALDIHAPQDFILRAGEITPTKISLGFATEFPESFAAVIIPRSSLGSRGLEIANTAGLIDADYRGEWIAILRATGVHDIEIKKNDRILQVFFPLVWAGGVSEVVEELTPTMRGDGGHGSTGR